MIWLLLSLLSTVFLYIGLKLASQQKMNPFHLVVFNYISPFLLGWYMHGSWMDALYKNWIFFALALSISIFIVLLILSKTTELLGVTITSLAHKTSMIIPIVMAVFLYQEPMGYTRITGILLALTGLFLTLYKPSQQQPSVKYLGYLFLIFLLPGFNDTLIKYVEHYYLKNDMVLFVTIMYFFALCISGTYTFFTQGVKVKRNTALLGLLIGLPNFGGFYFFFLALDAIPESSVVIALNNVGTILFSVLVGLLFFKETPSKINAIGIFISVVAVYILAYA